MQHIKWVEASLKKMLTIRPEMTRSDLMKVFTTEGGRVSRTDQTFVYKDCPYFKVHVNFQPASPGKHPQDRWTGSPDDKIRSISQPYLEWTVAD
jgi:hypothetical protein